MAVFYSPSLSRINKKGGFTLIELVVVVSILATLFVSVLLIFNPLAQLNKSQNAVRQHDFEEIKSSLDMYYDDTGCYPTSLTFFSQFASNNKIYMNTVPEDPKCQSNGQNCYIYQTDTSSSCPQWNVLYDTLLPPVSKSATCPLTSISSSCIPTNYTSLGLNYCVPSGKLDCTKIAADVTPVAPATGGTNGGGKNGGGTNSPTPTQAVCNQYYACTGMNGTSCNSLDQTAQENCQTFGGNLVCYCDSQCSNQCH